MTTVRARAPRQVAAVAMESFVFTYPLVLMELTRQQLTATAVAGELLAPMNQFAHMRELPSAPFTPVVSPNPDLLYSSAWLDLSAGPLIWSIPEVVGRHVSMPVHDAWTSVITSLGTRTIGGEAREFAVVGPSKIRNAPSELTVIQAPTSIVWIIARIQVDGPRDYEAVHRLQRALRLTPARAREASTPGRMRALDPPMARQVSPPTSRLARMEPQAYFRTVARLLDVNPPRPDDAAVVARMREVGLLRERSRAPVIDPQTSRDVARGMSAGLAQIEAAGRRPSVTKRNNWVFRHDARPNSHDYLLRAAAAWTGLGALPPEEGLTSTARQDAQGNGLTGACRYELRFRPGAAPPVHAFWSLAVQEAQPFFVSEAHHDVIRSGSGLRHQTDGSLRIRLQHEPPAEAEAGNRLRIPRGPFSLTLRLYWPRQEALNGHWWPPPVTRLP